MSTLSVESIFQGLWDMYGNWAAKQMEKEPYDNELLLDEFFFVILGGFGISYEQNISGLRVLKEKGLFDKQLYSSELNLESTIIKLRDELSKKQFEPITRTGEFRKYRFVETKPTVVASACYWLFHECDWNIQQKLNTLSDKDARNWLCTCPGIGLKSASWYMRNTGYSQDFAVFDVHIIRFLKKIGLEVPKTMTDKAYLYLEDMVRNICNNIGVNVGIMDYLLWILGRNGFLAYVGG